jgi:hypothetical protein
MKLHEKLSLIQSEFKAKKSRFNNFGKYNFRSAEDILEALKPFNKTHGVYFTVSERIVVADTEFPIMESIATISDGTDAIQAIAIVGVDLAQKGMQMPQKFGSASSYGKKYSLGNLLLIDDTADADATNNHGKGAINRTIAGAGNEFAKSKPEITDANIDKAKKFLANGGKVETLQQTYLMSAEILNKLKNG